MTDTPRTDAVSARLDQDDPDEAANQFYALARQLERENAELTAALAAHAFPEVYAERNAKFDQLEADRELLARCGYKP